MHEILSVVLKPGLISQASGSAYIETAKTKISCAVFAKYVSHMNNLIEYRFLLDTVQDSREVLPIMKKDDSTLRSNSRLSRVRREELHCG